jgi:hypothetical protein
MPCFSDYHVLVRCQISASVVLFSLLALPVVFVSSGFAQASGAAAANSSGAGGHSFASTPASSTSFVSHGFSSQLPVTAPAKPEPSVNSGQFHHGHNRNHIGGIYYPFPYTIAPLETENEIEADDNDADYQGGPTIFDCRGSGSDSYVPPVTKVPTPHSGVSGAALSVPDVPHEPILLIFKDGHKLEAESYAIVGPTLVDLTPGHQRNIVLADLDLSATRQQNGARGIIFHGPPQAPQVN